MVFDRSAGKGAAETDEAIQTNRVSAVGAKIDAVEKPIAEYIGSKYAVGLSGATAEYGEAVYRHRGEM